MINAVVYAPLADDPQSGRILWSAPQTTAGALAHAGRPWIEVTHNHPHYDQTHKVVAGRLVPIEA